MINFWLIMPIWRRPHQTVKEAGIIRPGSVLSEAGNEKRWADNEKNAAPHGTIGVSGIIINFRRVSPKKEVQYGVV